MTPLKYSLVALTLLSVFSPLAFGEEGKSVLLADKVMNLRLEGPGTVTLVRNRKSPRKITFNVTAQPFVRTGCAELERRTTVTRDAACGRETYTRRVCINRPLCMTVPPVCPYGDPLCGEARTTCHDSEECFNVQDERNRECEIAYNVCVRDAGYRQSETVQVLKVDFKHAPKLKSGQTETLQLFETYFASGISGRTHPWIAPMNPVEPYSFQEEGKSDYRRDYYEGKAFRN